MCLVLQRQMPVPSRRTYAPPAVTAYGAYVHRGLYTAASTDLWGERRRLRCTATLRGAEIAPRPSAAQPKTTRSRAKPARGPLLKKSGLKSYGIITGRPSIVRANFFAAMGFANRKPCTRSNPISLTAIKSARVSTPSATVRAP